MNHLVGAPYFKCEVNSSRRDCGKAGALLQGFSSLNRQWVRERHLNQQPKKLSEHTETLHTHIYIDYSTEALTGVTRLSSILVPAVGTLSANEEDGIV